MASMRVFPPGRMEKRTPREVFVISSILWLTSAARKPFSPSMSRMICSAAATFFRLMGLPRSREALRSFRRSSMAVRVRTLFSS
jgi:hypothetical protein